MGQTLFDALHVLSDAVREAENGARIPQAAIQQAHASLTCGFCTEPIDVYREQNQIFARFGVCGHLFHADPENMRSHTACYTSYIEAKKKDAINYAHPNASN